MPRLARTAAGASQTSIARGLRERRLSGVAEFLETHHAACALALYALAAALIERRAVVHLDSVCACNGGADPAQFMWAFVWWPYAILHGLNPFVTHAIWAPEGLDLARATSIPGAALIATPLTVIAGPVVTFNVLSVLAPVLAAWFAYRLCLRVTRSPGASIVGGYLYGFSSYELAHLIGLLHMSFAFIPPALALLALKRLDGQVGPRHFLALSTLLLIVQLLVSTEMLLTMTCMGAVALAAGWLSGAADVRARIVALLRLLVTAYAAMAIICSPFLYYALFVGHPYSSGWGGGFPADALGFVVPTRITWLGGNALSSLASRFLGNLTENGAYIGLPVVGIVMAVAIRGRRLPMIRALSVVLAVAALWSLGDRLYVGGQPLIRLPWSLLARAPLLDQLLPVRIAAYVALTSSVMVALWLASPGTRHAYRWAAAALAVVFLLPDTAATYPGDGVTTFYARLNQPSFFTTSLYRKYMRRGAVVLPIPFAKNGLSMLWQARTNMYFKLASGYFTGNLPAEYAAVPVVRQLLAGVPGPAAAGQLRAFVVRRGVDDIVADPTQIGPWAPVLARLGLRPTAVGGVLVYRVPPSR